MERYQGKPFLRVLECYVLNAIGQLHEHHLEALKKMEPRLSVMFGVDGTWQDIVVSQMDFPPSLPAKIREIWERNLEKFMKNGMPIDPEEFARAFVDENFQ